MKPKITCARAGCPVKVKVAGAYCKMHTFKKPSPKRKKKSGEAELFEKIWASRPHVSEVSGEPLPDKGVDFYPNGTDKWYGYFSHVLSKGAFPGFRLKEENVILMTPQEHDMWEGAKKSLCTGPEWDFVWERFEQLEEDYHQNHKVRGL